MIQIYTDKWCSKYFLENVGVATRAGSHSLWHGSCAGWNRRRQSTTENTEGERGDFQNNTLLSAFQQPQWIPSLVTIATMLHWLWLAHSKNFCFAVSDLLNVEFVHVYERMALCISFSFVSEAADWCIRIDCLN